MRARAMRATTMCDDDDEDRQLVCVYANLVPGDDGWSGRHMKARDDEGR